MKEDFSIDYVAGDNLNRQSMKPSQKEKKIKRFKDDKFQHLVSTDVLAEGFNIPEADIVINYDLPYNPVKIIQRVGRATRINVPKKIEIRNFNPDEAIDQELNLIDKLDLRISNIISLIGIDYSIWADTEKMIKEKEHLDNINKCKILKELKKRISTENPDEIYQIQLREESKLDLLLRNSIEHFDLKPEDIPDKIPSKPIYTTLIDKEPGFYGVYKVDEDYFEYGEPAEFIEESSKQIKMYNEDEIKKFCEIMRNKYLTIRNKVENESLINIRDKEIFNKLLKLKKTIPPLRDDINLILKSKLHTNFKIVELVDEIYPQVKGGFNWVLEREKVLSWKNKITAIIKSEHISQSSFIEEWAKNPEEYRKMVKAFIQYRRVDMDD